MSRRSPPPRVPVVEDSGLHKVALEIEASMHETMRARDRGAVSVCVSCLGAIGYKDFFFASPAYLGADSPSRRATIFDKASGWPWAERWFVAVKRIGWRPPRVATGRVHEYPEPYVRIDEAGVIEWGLEETAELDLCLWQFDRLVLRVRDQGQIVATTHTDDLSIDNRTTMAELHLTDDDYRFEIRIENSREGRRIIDGALYFVADPDPGMGVPGNGYFIDMAVVEGQWQEIGFQGRDWDGEHGDSGIVHLVTEEAAAARAEAERAKQERDAAELRERAERKARVEAERKAEVERRERERIGRLVARGMASAGLRAKYDALLAEAEAEVAAEAEIVAGATTDSVIAEAEGHAAHFAGRNDPRAAAMWQSVVDRLNGTGGITDEDLAAWLGRARQWGWRRGLQTLPKVIAVLAATEPVAATELDREDQALRDGIAARLAEVHHGPEYFQRWRRAGRAIGMPYRGVAPMTAVEADACARRYSSPLWPRVAAAIRAR